MALKRTFATCVLGVCAVSTASAQTAVGEVSVTGGVSSDQIAAGATQARIFALSNMFFEHGD